MRCSQLVLKSGPASFLPLPGYSSLLTPHSSLLTVNQLELSAATEPLDLGLAPERRGSVGGRLRIEEKYWKAPAGIRGSLSSIVRLKPSLQIVGDSRIQGAVSATGQVHEPAAGVFWLRAHGSLS